MPTPAMRIRLENDANVRPTSDFILYWMIAQRRTTWNFALDRAVEWAGRLKKPLVIFEPLRLDYRWASDRLHRFVLDGMADNADRIVPLRTRAVHYYPYVEPARDAGKGLLSALAERACVVVTDDYPTFFLPHMVSAAAMRLPVQVESVDSNGLLPMRATDQVFSTAYAFRRFLQKELPTHLQDFPSPDPLAKVELPAKSPLPKEILKRWPAADLQRLRQPAGLATLPIDHSVGIVDERGGTNVARKRLQSFLDGPLAEYATGANQPDEDTRSGLSAHLHFGHLSTHEMFHELMQREEWSPELLDKRANGRREGWWNASPGAEAWLDQFITWREVGFNMAAHGQDYEQFESLPGWALATLRKHAGDARPACYSLDEFASAETYDPLWNAAQRQLLREGRIHNYLRMLWGKKILEWSATPKDALEVMVELNNRYSLDGRDPNSYTGIFWVLGRYDRPWGPERPIFGSVRYMSSEKTARKLSVKQYLQRYAP